MDLKELIHVLRSATTAEETDIYRDEIIALIPQVKLMVGYDQHNLSHKYDLWEHSLWTVANLPEDMDDDMVYLAALLHDIGKPDCRIYGEKNGMVNMHYYGHPEKGVEIIRNEIIPKINKSDKVISLEEQRRLLYYVGHHDDHVSLRMRHLRKHLELGAGLDEFRNLMKLQVADAKAHIPIPVVQARIEMCKKLSGEYAEKLYRDIMDGK